MEVDGVAGGYPADLLELARDVAMIPGVPRRVVYFLVVFGLKDKISSVTSTALLCASNLPPSHLFHMNDNAHAHAHPPSQTPIYMP